MSARKLAQPKTLFHNGLALVPAARRGQKTVGNVICSYVTGNTPRLGERHL